MTWNQPIFITGAFSKKKKNGSWRFCIDYQSLNAVTIKDRFPIFTVEDTVDELYGVAYFTKLDL